MNQLEVAPSDYHRRLKCNRANIFAPDSFLSKSVIWELNNSSLFKWRYHQPEKKITEAMQWGSLIDCLTTTPELAETEIAISEYENFRTKAAQDWRESVISEGKIIVAKEIFLEAKKAAKMLTEVHPLSAEIFAKSKTQVIVKANLLEVKIKGLVDLAPEGEDFLADLKTTGKFNREGFARCVADYGYHVQAGLYLALWNAMFPEDQRHRFKLIWQDSAAPYEVAVTELHPDEISHGYKYAVALIRKLTEAAKHNRWPMEFEEQEPIIMRPTWAAIQEEEREVA